MLRIYRAPDGRTYQYEEGAQPEGFVAVAADKPKASPRKSRTPANKARKPQNKGR